MLPGYVDHVCSFVDVSSLRPLKVVADTANGMGGLVVPAVFDKPFLLDHMYPEPTALSNHPADPIQPETNGTMDVLTNADIGLASMATPTGCFWSTNRLGDLRLTHHGDVARSISSNPGATILHNPIVRRQCPRSLRRVAAPPCAPGSGTRSSSRSWPRPAQYSRRALGHYYFADNFRADSGLIAALVILEALSNHDGDRRPRVIA